jgi:hypothetical protein
MDLTGGGPKIAISEKEVCSASRGGESAAGLMIRERNHNRSEHNITYLQHILFVYKPKLFFEI